MTRRTDIESRPPCGSELAREPGGVRPRREEFAAAAAPAINAPHPRMRGFSLIATVFLITVLAALAVFIVTIGTTQRATSTLSIQAARAFAAASSGMEWAAAQVLPPATAPPGAPCFASPATFTLTDPGLNGFTVTASCSLASATPISEGSATYQVYLLSVTATSGSAATGDLVSRTLTASVTNAP